MEEIRKDTTKKGLSNKIVLYVLQTLLVENLQGRNKNFLRIGALSKAVRMYKEIIKQEQEYEEMKTMGRPSKEEYYLGIAKAVSKRSTCLRRQYGAVIVKNDEVISTGYNGSPRGSVNCCDIGMCERKKQGVNHGERYELCVAVHAEANAIISAKRSDMYGATLYLYGEEDGKEIEAIPCNICEKLIKNAGIKVFTNKKVENDDLDGSNS